jgi:hypothetical protein
MNSWERSRPKTIMFHDSAKCTNASRAHGDDFAFKVLRSIIAAQFEYSKDVVRHALGSNDHGLSRVS